MVTAASLYYRLPRSFPWDLMALTELCKRGTPTANKDSLLLESRPFCPHKPVGSDRLVLIQRVPTRL